MVVEKIETLKVLERGKMEELKFLRSKKSKWEGHRGLKLGLHNRRCMGAAGYWVCPPTTGF